MTSPVTDEPDEELRPPAPNSPPAANNGGVRLRWALWLLGLLAALPVIVTMIGAVTSPPHAPGVPVGHLVYLDADQPSEKTTILRGLYITQPGGPPRLLVHEDEPQDTDSGIRQWITEPAVSPDGSQVAYIQQNITLLEETHTQVTQLWVMPLLLPDAKPRLLLDLTKLHLKQVIGLSWTPDGRSVVFLHDRTVYRVPTLRPAPPTQQPLSDCPALKSFPDISATSYPSFTANGGVTYRAETAAGPVIVADGRTYPASGLAFAFDGRQYALATSGQGGGSVCRSPLPLWNEATARKVRWGWSIFGRRHITSLHWSPDGKYIGFTVSKPPVPEDELFYLDLASGKTYQLPVRTGRAAWDWTR